MKEMARDVRISEISPLRSPDQLSFQLPLTEEDRERIASYRDQVNRIISGEDRRLLAIVGPCSIHDPKAAIEYAEKLKKLSDELSDQFLVVMRTYFEKPRTALGWKGLIIDPDMDGTYDMDKGLEVCRKLLLDITHIGLPVGCECLDPIVPQYTDELMSWSSIGARTTESQTHRSLASGLSVAIGFKNSTSGDFTAAINAVKRIVPPEPAYFAYSVGHWRSIFLLTPAQVHKNSLSKPPHLISFSSELLFICSIMMIFFLLYVFLNSYYKIEVCPTNLFSDLVLSDGLES